MELSAVVEEGHSPISLYLLEVMAVLSDCSMCSSLGKVLKSEY